MSQSEASRNSLHSTEVDSSVYALFQLVQLALCQLPLVNAIYTVIRSGDSLLCEITGGPSSVCQSGAVFVRRYYPPADCPRSQSSSPVYRVRTSFTMARSLPTSGPAGDSHCINTKRSSFPVCEAANDFDIIVVLHRYALMTTGPLTRVSPSTRRRRASGSVTLGGRCSVRKCRKRTWSGALLSAQ